MGSCELASRHSARPHPRSHAPPAAVRRDATGGPNPHADPVRSSHAARARRFLGVARCWPSNAEAACRRLRKAPVSAAGGPAAAGNSDPRGLAFCQIHCDRSHICCHRDTRRAAFLFILGQRGFRHDGRIRPDARRPSRSADLCEVRCLGAGASASAVRAGAGPTPVAWP